MVHLQEVQHLNWEGIVPIMLSLAEASLSSRTMPSPLFRMVSRQSFLHISLENEVRALYRFAPATGFQSVDQDDDDDDGCVGNIESTSSSRSTEKIISTSEDFNDKIFSDQQQHYPICWFQDVESGTPLRWQLFTGVLYDLMQSHQDRKRLPWKLKVHFTSYPPTLLPLSISMSSINFIQDDVKQVIFRSYINSLKQSLNIQHGTNKVAHNMSKNDHLQIWEGITSNKFNIYHQVDQISDMSTMHKVPLKLLIDSRPAISIPCEIKDSTDTLKNILQEWTPDVFENQSNLTCIVQGIDSCFDKAVVDLWKSLSHPDKFLYVILKTSK